MGHSQQPKYVTVHRSVNLMGGKFDITVVADNEEIGYINIEEAVSEIKRIEKLVSSWDEESETSEINKNAGIKPVKVSVELFKLIERANQISEITNGAFDITFAGLEEIWKFDGSMKFRPTKDDIIQSVSKVGYRKIIMNEEDRTVFLQLKGMKIGLGGIAKGYAADMAKELLVEKQVRAGVINASGDLTTWGTKATGEKWLIGIANPLSKDKIFSWLPVLESSVATSESYDKYITFDGRKYSHILDPRTGKPISGINSVSVFSKTAELSDALATAIFVLGVDSGMALINQLKGTEAIIVDDNNIMHKSSGVLMN
ncbi:MULTISPECIES: FAD:protein FMN transferase [unclassified Arenibacter]|uniref:FAD:protein FMN transferase n=1 Tax=unclassified Arenibacter TaxID=2615047 RepID=UPI000E34B861|nr:MULTISPECIES: FAD:protein FMN transferase [unclassified Arenibacter]MCM4165780.1 thiamine biosynthesis protein ApbE [Arenibacter sp. A80]RFT54628.1 FAD:protein FMN transferase [Arenibacter sp. P308M17]